MLLPGVSLLVCGRNLVHGSESDCDPSCPVPILISITDIQFCAHHCRKEDQKNLILINRLYHVEGFNKTIFNVCNIIGPLFFEKQLILQSVSVTKIFSYKANKEGG